MHFCATEIYLPNSLESIIKKNAPGNIGAACIYGVVWNGQRLVGNIYKTPTTADEISRNFDSWHPDLSSSEKAVIKVHISADARTIHAYGIAAEISESAAAAIKTALDIRPEESDLASGSKPFVEEYTPSNSRTVQA